MKKFFLCLCALGVLACSIESVSAETMRFEAPFGEPWVAFVEVPETTDGLPVLALFEAAETGLIPDVSLSDLTAGEYMELPYVRDNGQTETIVFQVNELGVLEVGLNGAIWLVKDNYVPGTPPPARPSR